MAVRWGRPVSGRRASRGDAGGLRRAARGAVSSRTGAYGVVEIGGLLHAVPLENIREVTPRPSALLPFPSPRSDVIGAMQVRGSIVPVLDTVQLLGLRTTSSAEQILILRLGGGVVGLTVDRVHGVRTIEESQITTFAMSGTATDTPAVISAGFTHREERGVIIAPAALALQQSIPLAEDRSEARLTASVGHPAILFGAGAIRLGIDARAVVAMVPHSAVEPGPVASPLWLGFVRHVGKRIPLVDTLSLLGLGRYPRDAHAASVILRLNDGGRVALRIDAVEDMVKLDDAAMGPVGAVGDMSSALFRGLYSGNGESLIVDASALQADPRLIDLGKLEASEASAETQGGDGTRKPFLKFVLSGRVFATPLEQVEEIIQAPATLMRAQESGGPGLGLISYRGGAVPLLDIRSRLGLTASGQGESGFAVLISGAGAMTAILVDRLDSVERLPVQSLQEKPPGGEIDLFRNTITTEGKAYPVLDLRAIAAPVAILPHP